MCYRDGMGQTRKERAAAKASPRKAGNEAESVSASRARLIKLHKDNRQFNGGEPLKRKAAPADTE